jgi:peptidoglycan/xylan/chitin deacetylase (PgdA/CDA1 family)
MLTRNAQIRFAEPTGLMFHHFHGGIHPAVQGSIDAYQFRLILDAVGVQNILSADAWMQRAIDGELHPTETCVTFDDALLCQYDVAKPVLDELGIKAFWFIYTSVFEGTIEKLELFRCFRSTAFGDVDDFYNAFFCAVQGRLGKRYSELRDQFDPANYLPNSPFYTPSDRWFRFLRDQVLGQAYFSIIENMIDAAKFDRKKATENLWLRGEQARDLADQGHVIGLHSHSHPTTMGKLPREEQLREYSSNAERITALTGKTARVVSHPCNSYNGDTLELLTELGIKVGFRADVAPISTRGPLEYCREDHANILRRIQQP